MKRLITIFSISASLAYAVNISDAYHKSYDYEKMCSCEDAIKTLLPVYQKYPNGYTVNLRLGWLFFLNKKYENAIKHYKKALMVAPNSIEVNLGLLKSYFYGGNLENAVRVGNIILKQDLYNYYGNYYTILALEAKNNNQEALKLVNKMLKLYPTSIIYLQELAKISNPKKAKKIYESILILDPNNIEAKSYLRKKITAFSAIR